MSTASTARAVLEELVRGAADPGGPRGLPLAELSAIDLVRLDDVARTGWPPSAPWQAARWDDEALTEPTGLVAGVASMHPDGRVRQRAVQVLAGRSGRLSAALLALRAVDHVPEVRGDALAGLTARASTEGARSVLPVLLAVADRLHGPRALSDYTGALVPAVGDQVFADLLDSTDRRTRRWAFAAALRQDLLSAAALQRALEDRHDQWVRRAAADHLTAHPRAVGREALRVLLSGRWSDGRVVALAALEDDDLDDDELRAALLDRSSRVRDTARWRARRRGLDVTAFHREVLADGGEGVRAVVAALVGLARSGDAEDLPAIERRLDDPRPAVRAAAVRALGARGAPGWVSRRCGEMLLDGSPRVAAAAARALAAAHPAALGEVEERAWASAQPWSRRAAWWLGHGRGGWDRVEADARAAADPVAGLAELGRAGLLSWLQDGAATTYHRPDAARADRLATLLPATGLGADRLGLVAFHAGLPPPDPTPPVVADPVVAPPPRRTWRSSFRQRG